MPILTNDHAGRPLLAALALTAIASAVATGLRGDLPLAALMNGVLSLASSYALFVWFCRDSDLWRYARSRWRNIVFIGMGLLFVPWYLLRTRPAGSRVQALLGFGGFCLLYFFAAVLGGLAGMLLLLF